MRDVSKVQRLAIEDRVIAALKERGLLSTGQIRKLSGPILHTFTLICRCKCGAIEHRVKEDKVYDVTHSAAPLILGILKGLERRSLVLRIEPPSRNNGGGYQWLWIGE